MTTVTDDVITYLDTRGEPAKITLIARGTSRGETSVRRAVTALIIQGMVVRDKEGRIMTARKAAATKKAAKTEAPAPASTRKGQRPDTEERDAKVLAVVTKSKTGLTCEAIAEQLGVEKSIAYLSLHRLKTRGAVSIQRVESSRTPVYTAA